MKIVIEKNIPIPDRFAKSRLPRLREDPYPLGAMYVGDSFFVKCADTPRKRKAAMNQIRYHIKRFCKKNPSVRFELRTVPNGVRVWRTDDKTPALQPMSVFFKEVEEKAKMDLGTHLTTTVM